MPPLRCALRRCLASASHEAVGLETRRSLLQARFRRHSSTSASNHDQSRRWFPLLAVGAGGLVLGAVIQSSWTWAPKQTQLASPAQMTQAAQEIVSHLESSQVSFDGDVIEQHGRAEWSTSKTSGRPSAIVYPRTTEEVAMIARTCNKHNAPMVPFGAGSSVEGNSTSPHGGICIDFTFMDQIIAFRPEDMDVTLQPGVNWVDLNNKIASSGLFSPMDPSPTAQVGGMVATNCSGTNAMRYGTMKDWVVNLTVVLADGRIIKTRRRPRKNSAGYNLTSLFVGAEGTLGMVTEITLKLAPIPQDTSVAVASFPTIHEAAQAASSIIRSGIQLAALELMDDVQMQVLNRHGSAAVRKVNWLEEPTLFLKFSGTSDAITSDISRVKDLVKPHNARDFIFAKDKQDEQDLWAARKEALFTMLSIKPQEHELWSTDVAVPLSRLAELMDQAKQDCKELGLFASVVGHVGDGNFHTAMFYDPRDEAQKAAVSRVVHDMIDKALEMEGTVSGEHAIGIGKKDALMDELGEETIDVMRSLKKALDPKWLMNPGKIFDLPLTSPR